MPTRDAKPATNQTAPRLPGRPPQPGLAAAVHRAVLELLAAGGYAALSMDAVAARAQVARLTLYRRWQSKPRLVTAAVVDALGSAPAPDTGCTRSDLLAGVRTLSTAFAKGLGPVLPGLVAALAADPALARSFREQVLIPRRASMAAALRRGIERGELARDLDVELALDLLAAPLYYRTLFGHARVTSRTAAEVVDAVLAAFTPRPASSS
ncbi:MAG: TetR-like C-terminal domain-containing protein [Polyangia bacterium]